ncbi:peroxisomal OPC-8:0-CoA ligase 1-like [Wolffia australiana]
MATESGFSPSTGVYRSQWDNATSAVHGSARSLQSVLFTAAPPEKTAFVEEASGVSVTYGELQRRVRAVAGALLEYGVRRGDVVFFVSANSIDFPAVVLGIMYIGAVFSTANFLNTREELEAQVKDSNPVLAITTAEFREKLAGLIAGPLVLVKDLARATPAGTTIEPAAEETAVLMYSSGTTGKSKAVVGMHGNLLAMSGILRRAWSARGAGDVYLCAVPLFHMYGLSVIVFGAMAVGAKVVVLRRFSPAAALSAVAAHKVTRFPAVPPIVNQLAEHADLAKKFDLGSLEEVISAGAPLLGEVRDKFHRSFPEITLSQCYGLTETNGPITLCDGMAGKVHASIGRLAPTMEAKICDVVSRRALPPNEIGELCLRGPPVMPGYLGNPQATAQAFDEEGWFYTGDLCYIDAAGLIYVVDRMKELIKYNGYQVAPAELEEILLNHPAISDVAVLPHPKKEVGEIPVAYVVLRDGTSVKETEIISFVAAKVSSVAPYKKIRAVIFVDLIPRSPSGKILRHQLKQKTLQSQRFFSPRL